VQKIGVILGGRCPLATYAASYRRGHVSIFPFPVAEMLQISSRGQQPQLDINCAEAALTPPLERHSRHRMAWRQPTGEGQAYSFEARLGDLRVHHLVRVVTCDE
jgi:hypothetical protein